LLFLYVGPPGLGGVSSSPEPLIRENAVKATTVQIQAPIRENPQQLTMLLAKMLGVPEAEVVRAFPDNLAVELDGQRWEVLIRCVEAFGQVHIIVSNGTGTLEANGQFGG
jgi:putative heme iron utilization protein